MILREQVLDTYIDTQGYVMLNRTDRKHAPIKEHILVSEDMFFGPLPDKYDVHHLDENKTNNNPTNLMICSHAYHLIMHQRLKSIKACGISWWRKCRYCKAYDHPKNLFISANNSYHRTCDATYGRKRYQNPEIRGKKLDRVAKAWRNKNNV